MSDIDTFIQALEGVRKDFHEELRSMRERMDNNHEQVHTRINQLNRDLMTAVKPLENFSVGRRAATQAIIGLTFLLVALGGFVLALVEFMRE